MRAPNGAPHRDKTEREHHRIEQTAAERDSWKAAYDAGQEVATAARALVAALEAKRVVAESLSVESKP